LGAEFIYSSPPTLWRWRSYRSCGKWR
jgi:hypothetical protein